MTIKRFDNFSDLTSELAFTLIDDLKADGIAGSFGFSRQSCSAYVSIDVEDGDGDLLETIKVRFSDHADRHGSNFTMRVDHLTTAVTDCGAYVATEIDEAQFAALVADAKTYALELIAKAKA